MRRINKKEAIKMFRVEVMPYLIQEYGRGDKVAQREAWCNYTDMLNKDGYISNYQVENWVNPF